jgi:hypothetical protein
MSTYSVRYTDGHRIAGNFDCKQDAHEWVRQYPAAADDILVTEDVWVVFDTEQPCGYFPTEESAAAWARGREVDGPHEAGPCPQCCGSGSSGGLTWSGSCHRCFGFGKVPV